jgi:outer membrane protein OmpA-like peptidoglycan-associated protein
LFKPPSCYYNTYRNKSFRDSLKTESEELNMRKRCLLALAFVLMLSFSGYAQSDSEAQSGSRSKGSFFFSGGVYNGLFSNGPIVPIHNFEIKKLFVAVASVNYEFPMGAGNIALGLEGGYSSGSRFGGVGGVDFIPIGINAAFVFPLTSFFYVGPRLKIGGLGLLGDGRSDLVPLAGARLEAELRSTGFPLGLFVAGGIELFPLAPELAMLPVVEAGLRFPRGKLTFSGSSSASKNKESAGTGTGGSRDDLTGQNVVTGAITGAGGMGTSGTVSSGGAGTAGTGTTSSQGTTAGAGTAGSATGTGTGTAGAATGAGAGAALTGAGANAGAGGATVGSGTGGSATVGSGTAIAGVAQGQNRSVILENGKQGILNSIYFEPDTAVLIESYRPILESVGRQLAADSSLKLLIRAYAANFGTADGRHLVSVNRATFSRNFLTTQYGISASRFSSEAFGADKAPIAATDDWQHRCVELIMYRD